MKTITNHLSEIILSVAAVALVVGVLLAFSGPIGGFFEGVTDKLYDKGTGDIWNLGEYGSSDDNSGEGSDEVILMLEGDGQTFHKFAPAALTFRSNADISDFQEVQVNGVTVDPAYYTLTEGSTIITLSIDYLQTLDADVHEVTVISKNGAPSAGFEVIEPEVNEYGFYYNQPYVGHVDYFDEDWVFFLRENGTLELVVLTSGYMETCPYTIEGSNITVTNAAGDVFTGTLSEDGIYCNEVATMFTLGENETIIADQDYVYLYDADADAYYVAMVIDKTKSSYAPIRTGINGKPTTYIGSSAFENCVNLQSITIPECIEFVRSYAFYGCTSLEKVVFENCQVWLWGSDIFFDAPLTEGWTKAHSDKDNNNVCDRCNYCEHLNTELQNDTDEYTGDIVCLDCNKTVTYGAYYIPAGATYYDASTDTTLVEGDAFPVASHNDIYTYESCQYTYKLSQYWVVSTATDKTLTTYEILESINGQPVTTIDEYVFYNCTSLTSIELPASLTTICANAFWDCTSLESIEIPDSVRYIDQSAFRGCTSLKSFAVDEANRFFKDIDGNLYNKDGTTLVRYTIGKANKSFAVPTSVTTIGAFAFESCTSLTSIGPVGSGASVEIPASVTSIGADAFRSTSLESIVIPASVTTIGGYAFYWCNQLESVTFEEGSQLATIGDYAFRNCTSLESIVIPASVTAISGFSGCTSLNSITFGENSQLKIINGAAFSNCISLKSIVIPASVTSIEGSVFMDSTFLTNITFEGTVAQWNAITKGLDWNLNVPATEVICSDGTVALN